MGAGEVWVRIVVSVAAELAVALTVMVSWVEGG